MKISDVYFFQGQISLEKNPKDSIFGNLATESQALASLKELKVQPWQKLRVQEGYIFLDGDCQPYDPEEVTQKKLPRRS